MTVDYYLKHIRFLNHLNQDKEEQSYETIINSIQNWNIPQCVAYVIKKELDILAKDLIEYIYSETNWEDFLKEDPSIKDDINYLKMLDSIENLSRPWLKYEWYLDWNNTRYFFFSREKKNTYLYRLQFVNNNDNIVSIEITEK